MTKQELMIQENKELIKAVADVFRAKKEIEAKEKLLREQLLAACEKHGILGFDNDEMTVTYTPATTRESVDTDALKRDYPELFPMYLKTSNVKSSVRVTLKKAEKK